MMSSTRTKKRVVSSNVLEAGRCRLITSAYSGGGDASFSFDEDLVPLPEKNEYFLRGFPRTTDLSSLLAASPSTAAASSFIAELVGNVEAFFFLSAAYGAGTGGGGPDRLADAGSVRAPVGEDVGGANSSMASYIALLPSAGIALTRDALEFTSSYLRGCRGMRVAVVVQRL